MHVCERNLVEMSSRMFCSRDGNDVEMLLPVRLRNANLHCVIEAKIKLKVKSKFGPLNNFFYLNLQLKQITLNCTEMVKEITVV